MKFLNVLKSKLPSSSSSSTSARHPPEWSAAPEQSHVLGKLSDAPSDDYHAAELFCIRYPPNPPALLPSSTIDQIRTIGCAAWNIETPKTHRFHGRVQDEPNKNADGGGGGVWVSTTAECEDICLFSNLPIMAGLYDVHRKEGVYYEVKVHRMDGTLAFGTACRPYPDFRLPGWNRLSAGLHLDDLRKFFEDPYGGRDYNNQIRRIQPGDTVGCGYEFARGALFFTYNGVRLPDAFTGIYLPRAQHDVYAAVGVQGRCEVEVNFGKDLFRWKEGNEWGWRVEGHVGNLTGMTGEEETLPAYSA
ncbi:hypothetical protein AMATHDRAFT_42618 [Amanita thiersii Skay4041]|uniref:B30.2/SPRY domain-containing protein n=1 Tax=Amanita thiersii Skay4041 TaxID=703135 RepID=A0A2A9NA59_9AGAR|nr:hypothetical protein AMATHDRAFT_42618 [Amanita thiersii Skay4041]